MNTYLFAVLIIALLTLAFPFTVLMGVFDCRADGGYKFREGLFLKSLFALLFLNGLSSFFLIYGIEEKFIDVAKYAETHVLKARASVDRALEDMSVMFPSVLNQDKKKCYRSALSNYVEDVWNETYERTSCEFGTKVCAKNDRDYFDKSFEKSSLNYSIAASFGVWGMVQALDWNVAKDVLAALKSTPSMQHEAESQTAPQKAELKARYDSLLAKCGALSPLPWATPGVPLLVSFPHIAVEKR